MCQCSHRRVYIYHYVICKGQSKNRRWQSLQFFNLFIVLVKTRFKTKPKVYIAEHLNINMRNLQKSTRKWNGVMIYYLSTSPTNFLAEKELSGSSEPLKYFLGSLVIGFGKQFLCPKCLAPLLSASWSKSFTDGFTAFCCSLSDGLSLPPSSSQTSKHPLY